MAELPAPKTFQDAARAARAQATALAAVARALKDGSPTALVRVLDRLEALPSADAGGAVAEARAWLEEEEQRRRQVFSGELKALCAAAGVEIVVLGREPLELRLPPVSVVVDWNRNQAEILFAGIPIGRSEVRASAIMDARSRAVAFLEGQGWDPSAWLGALREAWVRATRGSGEWAELQDVLPELAFLLQPRKFRKDPVPRNLEAYPRVRFAYDLWRVRRDRVLAVGGWRLTLGPATGGSTRDKSRVLKLEDALGQGQYHLTLRFVREEAALGSA